MSHQNEAQINKYNTQKNRIIVDHNYKVGDRLMLNNKYLYKYGTPYKGRFEIIQFWTNGMVTIKMAATRVIFNIRHINARHVIRD